MKIIFYLNNVSTSLQDRVMLLSPLSLILFLLSLE